MPGAEHVVPHEDLPVRPGTGSDPDGGYLDRAGDVLTELTRHGFQHDGEGAGLFERQCGAYQGLGGCGGATLHTVPRK